MNDTLRSWNAIMTDETRNDLTEGVRGASERERKREQERENKGVSVVFPTCVCPRPSLHPLHLHPY